LPGVYHNTGPAIRTAVTALQSRLDDAGIPLRLVAGADNHVEPNFVASLAAGRLLTLNDTRYVLVEPPHHIAPPRLGTLFTDLQVAGYVPILTHPERLSWIRDKYPDILEFRRRGVLMQITAGSLRGAFGDRARYWAERMLGEGQIDVLASDAHNVSRRPPDLAAGYERARAAIGMAEADNLVVHRPRAILENIDQKMLPPSMPASSPEETHNDPPQAAVAEPAAGSLVGRLRRLIG
jgi:protein-tyrosine phosphatase